MTDPFTPTTAEIRAVWGQTRKLHAVDRATSYAEFERWIADHDRAVAAEARAEVGDRFSEWAAKNEIANPPLDWAWFGEIVYWTGSQHHVDNSDAAEQ